MGASEGTKKGTESTQDAELETEETPIFHPSQAEGERRTDNGEVNGAESRPRPSQAEGERDEIG